MDPITISAVIISLGAAVTGFYLAGSRRRVNEAHATEALTNAATTLIQPLRDESAELRERMAAQGERLAAQDMWSKKQDEAIADLRRQHEDCLKREAELSARIEGLAK